MKKQNNFISFIRRFHIIPKLVCLLFAFIFWIYVMEVDSPDYEGEFQDIPLTIVGTTQLENDHNLSVFSGHDALVDIKVKGQKTVISKYSADDITVRVDVSDIKESGMYTLDLFFELPSDISLIDSSVSEVNMFIDKRTSANIDVEVNLRSYKISSAEYALGDVVCDTDTIMVTGPASIIEDIDHALVEIDLKDAHLTESLSTSGEILLKNQNGGNVESKFVKLSKTSAQVNIPVFGYKEIPLNILTKYGFYTDKTASISIEPATVKVKGDPSTLNSIEYINISTLDEKTIKENTELLVDINLPSNVFTVEGEPSTASVYVDLKGLERKTFFVKSKNIEIIGADGKNVQILDESLAVTVLGEKSVLNSMKADDITVKADISGFKNTSGVMYPNAEISFETSDGVVFEIGNYSIRVQYK